MPLESEGIAPLCIQCARKYIITPGVDGLMVIDQHRAHVKILYERYMRESGGNGVPAVQRVIFADPLMLDTGQEALLEGVIEQVNRLGFALSRESDGVWRITGVPATLGRENARDVLLKIIDSVADDSVSYVKTAPVDANAMLSRVALLTARASAIQRGQYLSAVEMEHLIGELFALPEPNFTPTGNPVVRTLPVGQLASLFNS